MTNAIHFAFSSFQANKIHWKRTSKTYSEELFKRAFYVYVKQNTKEVGPMIKSNNKILIRKYLLKDTLFFFFFFTLFLLVYFLKYAFECINTMMYYFSDNRLTRFKILPFYSRALLSKHIKYYCSSPQTSKLHWIW